MKNLKYILFIFIIGFISLNVVNAKEVNYNSYEVINVDNNRGSGFTKNDNIDFCTKDNVKGVFRAIGWLIVIIKIIVPLVIIAFGVIEFAKAMVSSKEEEIKKAGKNLVISSILGIFVFFIPAIISFVTGLVGGEDIYNESFGVCTNCMLNPGSCEIGK